LRNDMLKQADLDELKDNILQTVERRMSQRSEHENVSGAKPEGGELELEEWFDCSLKAEHMLERTS
jgi:hypothetical protein